MMPSRRGILLRTSRLGKKDDKPHKRIRNKKNLIIHRWKNGCTSNENGKKQPRENEYINNIIKIKERVVEDSHAQADRRTGIRHSPEESPHKRTSGPGPSSAYLACVFSRAEGCAAKDLPTTTTRARDILAVGLDSRNSSRHNTQLLRDKRTREPLAAGTKG